MEDEDLIDRAHAAVDWPAAFKASLPEPGAAAGHISFRARSVLRQLAGKGFLAEPPRGTANFLDRPEPRSDAVRQNLRWAIWHAMNRHPKVCGVVSEERLDDCADSAMTEIMPVMDDYLARLRVVRIADEHPYRAEEVTYWRNRAKAAEQRIREAAGFYPDDPPEPPIGTTYARADGTMTWVRREDGWHCSKNLCFNCPCDWAEACQFGLLDESMVRTLPPTAIVEAA